MIFTGFSLGSKKAISSKNNQIMITTTNERLMLKYYISMLAEKAQRLDAYERISVRPDLIVKEIMLDVDRLSTMLHDGTLADAT